MSYAEELNQAAEEYGLNRGGEYFKIKDGDNKVRVLSHGVPIATHKFGQKFITCYGQDNGCQFPHDRKKGFSVKFMFYVIDRADGKVKLARFPYTVAKYIADLQADDDWSFEDFPMPYDFNLKAKGAGTLEVEYTFAPSPKRVELTAEEAEAIANLDPVDEIVNKMKEKSRKENNDPNYNPNVGTAFDDQPLEENEQ